MTNQDLERFQGFELFKSDVAALRELEKIFKITPKITDDLIFTHDFEEQWTCMEKLDDRFNIQIQNHRITGMRINSAIEAPFLTLAPECIYELDALLSLEIYMEGLKQFPNGLARLTKLEKLDISCHYELLSFPQEVWKLVYLTYLDIWGLPFKSEPTDAINLTNLEFLRCTDNVHKEYENLWNKLPKLRFINYWDF